MGVWEWEEACVGWRVDRLQVGVHVAVERHDRVALEVRREALLLDESVLEGALAPVGLVEQPERVHLRGCREGGKRV